MRFPSVLQFWPVLDEERLLNHVTKCVETQTLVMCGGEFPGIFLLIMKYCDEMMQRRIAMFVLFFVKMN